MSHALFQDGSGTELRIKALSAQVLRLVYEYVCRSLFKADRMMFAMHMVHGYRPDLFEENVSLIKFDGSILKSNYKRNNYSQTCPQWSNEITGKIDR